MNTKIILTTILLSVAVSVSAQTDTSVRPKKPVPNHVPRTDSMYKKGDPMRKDSSMKIPQKKKELSPMDTVLRSQPQH